MYIYKYTDIDAYSEPVIFLTRSTMLIFENKKPELITKNCVQEKKYRRAQVL